MCDGQIPAGKIHLILFWASYLLVTVCVEFSFALELLCIR